MTSEKPLDETTQLKAQLARYEQKVRNNESRIRSLIESIPLGLFILEPTGIVESASPACLALFRCSYADLHRQNLAKLFSIDADSSVSLLSTSSNQTTDVTATRLDGTQFPASIKVSSFGGSSDSSQPRLLLVVEDVSTRYELEQLRQEFISTMTHDLRSPLTSVKCLMQLVAEGVYDSRLDELKAKCADMGDDANRLISMISSLLDLHKLEAGKLQLDPQPVSLHLTIKSALQAVDAWAESLAVSLEVSAFPDNLTARIDSDYTVRVLVNLLSNAIKFSPPDTSVKISVEPIEGTDSVEGAKTSDASKNFIRLSVSDEGKGIAKEFQSRLFNRFEQAEVADSRIKGGTGLGLAISKAIVEAQGGSIGVESEPDQGCTFWFTVPRD